MQSCTCALSRSLSSESLAVALLTASPSIQGQRWTLTLVRESLSAGAGASDILTRFRAYRHKKSTSNSEQPVLGTEKGIVSTPLVRAGSQRRCVCISSSVKCHYALVSPYDLRKQALQDRQNLLSSTG